MKNFKTLSPSWSLAALAAAMVGSAMMAGCWPSRDSQAQTAKAVPMPPAQAAIARGKVEVEGGLIELSAAADGLVRQVTVSEGQSVQRGQVLLRLDEETAQADVEVAEAESRLAQARHKARADKLPALRQTAQRMRAAAAAGASDAQRADEAEQALRDAESELAVADAEVQVARRKGVQARAQLSRMEIRAPEAGVMVRVLAQPGMRVAAHTSSLVLLPKRPLVVRAEINESYASAVREGMLASVTTDGEGGQEKTLPSARVLRISPVFGSGRLQEDTQRGPVRVVECVLAFEQAPQVRVGQNVRVSFHE